MGYFDNLHAGLADHGVRFDSGQSSLMEKALTKTLTKIQETVYSEAIAQKAVPVAMPEGTGLSTIEHYMAEEFGELQLIGPGADDLPSSGEKLTKVTRYVANYGGKFSYSLQDFERWQRANMNGFSYAFDARRGNNARRISERKIDSVLFSESDPNDPRIKGFFGYSLAAVGSLTGGWATSTEVQKLDDLRQMWQTSYTGSGGEIEPDTIILPSEEYGILKTTFRTNTDRTLLSLFSEELNVRILRSARLDSVTSATNSLSTAPTALCFKYDPDLLSLHIPRPFQLRPGKWNANDKYQVNYYLDFAGLFVDFLPNIACADLS